LNNAVKGEAISIIFGSLFCMEPEIKGPPQSTGTTLEKLNLRTRDFNPFSKSGI